MGKIFKQGEQRVPRIGYKFFYKLYKEDKGKNADIAKPKEYTDFLRSTMARISGAIIDGLDYKVPHGLGSIMIVKAKKENRPKKIDMKIYKETGKKVYFDDAFLKGYRFSFKWKKSKLHIPDSRHYNFTPAKNQNITEYNSGYTGLGREIFGRYKDPYKKDYDALDITKVRK